MCTLSHPCHSLVRGENAGWGWRCGGSKLLCVCMCEETDGEQCCTSCQPTLTSSSGNPTSTPPQNPSALSLQPITQVQLHMHRPIQRHTRKKAVKLKHNEATFIIQLGICQRETKKEKNLGFRGKGREWKQKELERVDQQNKQRTVLAGKRWTFYIIS